MALRQLQRLSLSRVFLIRHTRAMSTGGDLGSGVGKGGGSGGSIRDAGGAFGQKEAAQEEQYFRQQQAEQLAALKKHIHEEIAFHQEQIKENQDDIERHKKKLEELKHLHKE